MTSSAIFLLLIGLSVLAAAFPTPPNPADQCPEHADDFRSCQTKPMEHDKVSKRKKARQHVDCLRNIPVASSRCQKAVDDLSMAILNGRSEQVKIEDKTSISKYAIKEDVLWYNSPFFFIALLLVALSVWIMLTYWSERTPYQEQVDHDGP